MKRQDGRVGSCHDAVYELLEVRRHQFDRGRVEELLVVLEVPRELGTLELQFEREIEAGEADIDGNRTDVCSPGKWSSSRCSAWARKLTWKNGLKLGSRRTPRLSTSFSNGRS